MKRNLRRGDASAIARTQRRGVSKATGPRNPNVTVRKTTTRPTAARKVAATGRSLRKTTTTTGANRRNATSGRATTGARVVGATGGSGARTKTGKGRSTGGATRSVKRGAR